MREERKGENTVVFRKVVFSDVNSVVLFHSVGDPRTVTQVCVKWVGYGCCMLVMATWIAHTKRKRLRTPRRWSHPKHTCTNYSPHFLYNVDKACPIRLLGPRVSLWMCMQWNRLCLIHARRLHSHVDIAITGWYRAHAQEVLQVHLRPAPLNSCLLNDTYPLYFAQKTFCLFLVLWVYICRPTALNVGTSGITFLNLLRIDLQNIGDCGWKLNGLHSKAWKCESIPPSLLVALLCRNGRWLQVASLSPWL